MEFRIGIQLGDVVIEGNAIYGDGRNAHAPVASTPRVASDLSTLIFGIERISLAPGRSGKFVSNSHHLQGECRNITSAGGAGDGPVPSIRWPAFR